MTKSLEEKIAVMQAALEGETIQMRYDAETWTDWLCSNSELSWNWDIADYRVKPWPLVGYFNVYEDGTFGFMYRTAEEARKHQFPGGRMVKMMEVVE